jgi:hypothetical protein
VDQRRRLAARAIAKRSQLTRQQTKNGLARNDTIYLESAPNRKEQLQV